MESRIKNYVKKKEKLKHKEKEKESYSKIQKLPSTKIKKEKTQKEKFKKEETLKPQRNAKSNNKLISGMLSDSETIKTETTRGDTLIDNYKCKYVYKKNINKKNYSFAIKNSLPNKNGPMSPRTVEKKSNRINFSSSLNIFLKENKSNENILNTNQYFYRKQPNILENYRTANLAKYYDNYNTFNERNSKFSMNDINNTNISLYYENTKREEFINIEDLLILEEKFNDVLTSVKSKHNTPNECFELLNAYQQSSVYNNFENYFNSIESNHLYL